MKSITLLDYLKLCIEHKLYFKRRWRLRMSMTVLEAKESPDLHPYIDGKQWVFTYNDELYTIDDIPLDRSPLKWRDVLKLPKGFLPNIKSDIETTYGRLLLNIIGFVEEFGDLIPYHNEEFTANTFHKIYYGLYKAGKIKNSSQLINSISRLSMLEADAEMGVPAASIETFTTHPDMKKRLAEEIEKNKDDLNNPAKQAQIDKVGVTLDKEYVKGTQAEAFFISGKMHSVVRKKTKMMYGSETNLDGRPTDLITKPLAEGLELDRMEDWVNVARAGSISRGGLTAMGGYEVKLDDNAYGHLEVSDVVDCKTKKGLPVTITDSKRDMYVGMRILGSNEVITPEFVQKNMDKIVTIRVPGYCKLENDYCQHCMGDSVAKDKYGIPSGVMLIDSKSMDAMMQAAHGKAVEVTRVPFN